MQSPAMQTILLVNYYMGNDYSFKVKIGDE